VRGSQITKDPKVFAMPDKSEEVRLQIRPENIENQGHINLLLAEAWGDLELESQSHSNSLLVEEPGLEETRSEN
jgi:hypothetical protein